jgi:hypothetical protein
LGASSTDRCNNLCYSALPEHIRKPNDPTNIGLSLVQKQQARPLQI